MLRTVVNSASVAAVSLEIHTTVVMSHHDQCANQIHVHQMANALFKKTVKQFASVHTEWVETRLQLAAMDTNVTTIQIVQKIMHV